MRKRVLGLVLACALVAGWSAGAVIRDIRIVDRKGETFDVESVSAFTSFRKGEEVKSLQQIEQKVAADVERMRRSGRFTYVNARIEKQPDGDFVLIYSVAPKYRLHRITVTGADSIRNSKIRKALDLKVGTLVDDADFARAAAGVKETYRDFWHPNTEVTWKAETNEKLGTVDVTFRVKEGPKVIVRHIEFEGNEHIPDKELLKVMQQKTKRWYSFLTGAGKFHPEYLDADVFAIKSLYQDRGFLDVQVEDPVVDMSDPRSTRIIFRIHEGRQYKVGKVEVKGAKSFPAEELLKRIPLHPGDVASYGKAMDGVEALRAFYGNRGYVRVRIEPVFTPHADTGTVDVLYKIHEGPVGYIRRINIEGAQRTRDKVIRRELIIYPGDKYNRARVKASENRLRNLNYFELVTSSVEPTDELGQYDLDFRVKEKPTGQFSAGVSFSSIDALVGYVELSQGNFDIRSWPPIGGGQKFKIRAQIGSERKDLILSFVEPWFMDRKLSFGLDLYHRENRYFSDDYEQKIDGVRVSFGKPLTRFTRGTIAYAFERFEVYDVEDTASDAIKAEEGSRLKSGLSFTWTLDTRDRFFVPTRGNRTTVMPYFAGGPLGAETDIYGIRVRSSQFWPLKWGLVLNLRGQVETVDSFGDSDYVPIFDRLFLGGAYTLRGFEYRDVGPKDNTGEPIGGRSSLYGTVELTYPIWNKIRGAIFYDWGVVNEDAADFSVSDYNDDAGIGIRLDIPGFPLHLDYAWPITYDEKWQDGTGRFNFLIGHVF